MLVNTLEFGSELLCYEGGLSFSAARERMPQGGVWRKGEGLSKEGLKPGKMSNRSDDKW